MGIIALIVIIYIVSFVFLMNDSYHSGGDFSDWLFNVGMMVFTGAFFCALVVLPLWGTEDPPELVALLAIPAIILIALTPQILFRFKTRYLITGGLYLTMLVYIFTSEGDGNLLALVSYIIPIALFVFLLRKAASFSVIMVFITIGWNIAAMILFSTLGWTDDSYRGSNLLAAVVLTGGVFVLALLSVPFNSIIEFFMKNHSQKKIARYYVPVCLGILTVISIASGLDQAIKYNVTRGTATLVDTAIDNYDCYVNYTDDDGNEHRLVHLNSNLTAMLPGEGEEVKIIYARKKAPEDAPILEFPEGTNSTGHESATVYIYYMPIALALGALTAASAYMLIIKKKKETENESDNTGVIQEP